jgi:hypothetical protein
MIAFTSGALAALGWKLDAAPPRHFAVTYAIAHPMGVLRLPTPDEYAILEARTHATSDALHSGGDTGT